MRISSAVFAAIVLVAARSSESAESLEDVKRGLQQLQQRGRSFDLRADVKRMVVEGGGPHEFASKLWLVLDATGRVRLEDDGELWSTEKGAWVAHHLVCIFDGSVKTAYMPVSDKEFPAAHVSKYRTNELVNNIRMLPILAAVMPLHPVVGLNELKDAELAGEEFIDELRCLKLRCGPATIWVCPDLDYAVVRHHYRLNADLSRQVDVSYFHDDRVEPRFTGWRLTRLSGDTTILELAEARVTSLKLNSPIDDATFQLSFPPGTWVKNYITGDRVILRENKPPRPILKGEYNGKNYQELLKSEPPSGLVPRAQSSSMTWLIIAGNVFALALIVGGVVFARQQQRKSRGPGSGIPRFPSVQGTLDGE